MFSVDEKRSIANRVQQVLRETKHPELPQGEISFLLHVDGAKSWSWADIRNNGAVATPNVNPWNEAQAPKSAPATPAATPMAGNGYETAAVMRDLFREWWDKHDTATKLRKPQEMTAFQRIQNAFYAGALAIMDRQRAVAMNSEAPQKLPAAAQPQRESEQPEQALRELKRVAEVFAARVQERNPEWFRETDTDFAEADHALRAALSPEPDSQEPR